MLAIVNHRAYRRGGKDTRIVLAHLDRCRDNYWLPSRMVSKLPIT